MKKDLQNIVSLLREINPYLKETFEIESIEIFGSYARESHNGKSDLDLLVTFKNTPGLLKYLEIQNYISDRIGIKVDLVMKNSIKPRLRNSILNGAILI